MTGSPGSAPPPRNVGDQPVDQACDELLTRLAAEPDDDVCVLAVRTPNAKPGS
jgi:hypothetical protein